ncbi:MAG: stringent starvation protein B [Glaciecola sp.]|jgi:stringent starvation protein B
MDNMTSNQPYLLKAFCDWIVDNGLTPYIVVDADLPGVEVPTQFVKDGQIVLNVSPSACVNLNVDLEGVSFQARFSGQPMQVFVPCIAVSAIYARENGAGTVFTHTPEELAAYEQSMEASKPTELLSVSNVIADKSEKTSIKAVSESGDKPAVGSIKSVAKSQKHENEGDNNTKPNKPASSKKRPSLKVVK